MRNEGPIRERLGEGLVIPACPLALTRQRKLDERRQRALVRYYAAAGAGGIAVGVHMTQFAIRNPGIGLFEPVLTLASEEMARVSAREARRVVRIAGVCGELGQAAAEAELAASLGYDVGIVSLAALPDADEGTLVGHCRALADIMPIMGFYLQPSVGGRPLSYDFWRRFAEIENVVAIKIAPFSRYQTLDVVRAVAESGRDDIALCTGNDDSIVSDLVTPFRFRVNGRTVERRIVGGLLGHWAVWTRNAVEVLEECHAAVEQGCVRADLAARGVEITDCNAAFFDVANGFAGCIAGIHEVLRRAGLFDGIWCLDPNETLSPGQADEIDRVCRAYRHLSDDTFVAQHLEEWLSG